MIALSAPVQIDCLSASGFPSPSNAKPAGALRNIFLCGTAGRLEAALNESASVAPFAALVCHPHPVFGGTMHNKVVYQAMKVLNDPQWGFGWPVLRFNFRGAGLSEGVHDGLAEVDDVRTAFEWLHHEYARPVVVVGFSFGAAMALAACCRATQTGQVAHPTLDIRALIALGLPMKVDQRTYDYSFLREAAIPKLFLSGDRDQFASPGKLAEVVEAAAEPKRFNLIPGADHFFTGRLESMQQAIAVWLREQTS